MAAYDLITFNTANGRKEKEDSSSLTIDFAAVSLGPSDLTISEVGGAFSFGGNPVIDVTTLEIGASGLLISEIGGELSINSVQIAAVSDPGQAQDLANKDYVDRIGQGFDFKASVLVTSFGVLPDVTALGSGEGKTLTADNPGLLTIDGISTWVDMVNDGGVNDPFPPAGFTAASRVLVNGEANSVDNGIYVVQNKGDGSNPFILVRSVDFDENDEIHPNVFVFTEQGTMYGDTGWVCSNDGNLDIDVDPINFQLFSEYTELTAGDGVDITASEVSVDLAAVSGLEFDVAKLRVDLAAAGTGTGGLVLTGNEIEINSGDGTELTSSGLAVQAHTDAGTATEANAIGVLSTGVYVSVDASSIEGSAQGGGGLENLRVANAGITEDHLSTSVAGDGLGGGAGTPLAVNTGDGLGITSGQLVVDSSESLENNQGVSIGVHQIVAIHADGKVKLAQANTVDLDKYDIGVVEDTTIAHAASGEVVIRPGAVISGFSSLTPGKRQYVSRTTAGALTETLSGFTSNDLVYKVGRAKSPTELIFNPKFEFAWGGPPPNQLLANNSFQDGNTGSWVLVNSDPGGNPPTLETYNPATSQLTDAEKVGTDNYYLEGGGGGTSTTLAQAYQNVDVTSYQNQDFTVSAYLGGAFTGDEAGCWVEFRDSGTSLVGTDHNQTLRLTDFLWNDDGLQGTYVKTSLRGYIDYDAGYKFVTDAEHVVYHMYGNKNIIAVKFLAFASDRWSVYKGITWDFDSLVDDFYIGDDGVDYIDEIITTSGGDTDSGLKYPPVSSNKVTYSDYIAAGWVNHDDRWVSGPGFIEGFLYRENGGTIPATATEARVVLTFENDSTGNNYATIDEVSLTITS